MSLSRRQLLAFIGTIAISGVCAPSVNAAADPPAGEAPWIKVSVTYQKTGQHKTYFAEGAVVELHRDGKLVGTKKADSIGHAVWTKLPLSDRYRVRVRFQGQTKLWLHGQTGEPRISIDRTGTKRRPYVHFIV